MPQDQQAIQKSERDRRHHEQVHRSDAIRMIAQKGSPPLRRPSPPPRHVLGYARLPDIDAEFEQLAVDPRRTPQRIGKAHVADQPTNLQRHLRPPAARPRLAVIAPTVAALLLLMLEAVHTNLVSPSA